MALHDGPIMANATLLIVDDEPLVRWSLRERFTHDGYNVIEAVNSTEALELLDARPDISLMLTDVRMPGELDGYNLSRLVRMKYPAIGIIVISGDSLPRESDLPQGARFLAKPLLPSVLLGAIRETLAQGPAVPGDSNDRTQEERPVVPPPIMADRMIDPTPIGTGLAQPLAEPDEN